MYYNNLPCPQKPESRARSGCRGVIRNLKGVFCMIEVMDLRKTFKVARREGGFKEAVKALFHRE